MSGITPEGFDRPTQQDLLKLTADDLHTDLDPNLDTSTTAPHGQHNNVTSRQAALAWEVLEELHDGRDPDKAEDEALIALCKLTGTVPRAATFTEADCSCDLDAGTELVTEDALASVAGLPDVLFTPKETFIAPGNGTFVVRFRALVAGPTFVAAGQLSVIQTTITGWNSITNLDDAIPGALADGANGDWSGLRARREAELAKAGSTTARAIRADLLALEDEDGALNVRQVLVLENDKDDAVNGIPAHSIECIVYDAPTLDNDLIGEQILESKAAGIKAHGQIASGVTDDSGNAIKFSRPTPKDIYLIYDLTTDPATYAGDTDFKAKVVEALTAVHTVSDDVLRWTCEQAAKLPGVLNVVSLKLGFAPTPTLSADLPIADREIASFSTTRVDRI
jgi:hypothetical protein